MKERMVAGADDDVEIAGRPAVESRISLSREANSLPIARARFNADGQRLVADHHAIPLAHIADCARMSGAAAAWARYVELHASTGLGYLSLTAALGAGRRALLVSAAAAGGANVLPADVHPQLGAAYRLPKAYADLVLKICARLWTAAKTRLVAGTASSHSKDVAENIAEAAGAGAPAARPPSAGEIRKIEAAKIEGDPRCATARTRCPPGAAARPSTGISLGRCRIDVVGVKTKLVIDLALLGIAQNIIGLGDFLEPLLGFLVPRINVRMVLARQLAESFANFFSRGVLLDAERAVIIFGLGGHWLINLSLTKHSNCH